MSDLITPRREDSVFIGWEASSPAVDRRFLLTAAAGLVVTGGATAAALASLQGGPGSGTWDQGAVHTLTGRVVEDPYPRLITADLEEGAVRSVFLVCPVKCGPSADQLDIARQNETVAVSGTLLVRGRNAMMAVNAGADAIAPYEQPVQSLTALLARIEGELGEAVPLGRAELRGEILDSKCWFGAMRPGEGKPHKACAALCIRFGVPPAFLAPDAMSDEHALILADANGGKLVEPILPLIADPVSAVGQLVARGDMVQFRVDPADIRRL